MIKKWKNVLPHITIIMALYIGTMWVLNLFNPLMDFMGNSSTMAIIFLFCIVSIVNGYVTLEDRYAREDEEFKKKLHGSDSDSLPEKG